VQEPDLTGLIRFGALELEDAHWDHRVNDPSMDVSIGPRAWGRSPVASAASVWRWSVVRAPHYDIA
jgi:hypothetical protein